jgi:invasion protein IalB
VGANLQRPHFPVKSAETVIFAAGLRLTGELPDVRTDDVFHRNLIRDDGWLFRRRTAFKAPSLPYQSSARTDIAKGILQGNTGRMTLTGPSKQEPSRPAGRGSRWLNGSRLRGSRLRGSRLGGSSLCGGLGLNGRIGQSARATGFFLTAFLTVFLGSLLGLTASANAQGAVRSVHGDWQIRCDTPPGAQTEQCALIQSVVAEDRSNAGLTVIVLKTADQKSKLMRVVAPLGVLLPSGLGLKLDNVDVGRAGFVRCLPNGCVAEVVMDDKLLGQLRSAKTATFIIFETPEEGIGFPLSLNGLGEGYDKLP